MPKEEKEKAFVVLAHKHISTILEHGLATFLLNP